MPAIAIPDPLPPAITPPRTVIEFLVDQDLEEFGDTGLVARTWQLLAEVKSWCDTKPEEAKAALEISAAEVIAVLREMRPRSPGPDVGLMDSHEHNVAETTSLIDQVIRPFINVAVSGGRAIGKLVASRLVFRID
jgi:hypothetical protein